jgi:hypothetical protein
MTDEIYNFDADRKAVADTSFCSLWPAGRAALQALLGVVSNTLVKAAISMVLSAGDAYCKPAAAVETATDHDSIMAKFKADGVNTLDDLANQIEQKAKNPEELKDWIVYTNLVLH